MGQDHSVQQETNTRVTSAQQNDTTNHQGNVSAEALSHELAVRFARRCFSQLELSHFQDVFRSLADEQDGVRYWKEETLNRFLALPNILGNLGPSAMIYQMATYLGAFPFPSQAPSILTMEALLKTIVIMTDRYSHLLKQARHGRIKLLFRSLAVFDRRMSRVGDSEQAASPCDQDASQMDFLRDLRDQTAALEREQLELHVEDKARSDDIAVASPTATAFSPSTTLSMQRNIIDNEDEEEDDESLALAALDLLNATEIFKHDHRSDTKIHHAQIPMDNFRQLILLLLIIAPLAPEESLVEHAERMKSKTTDGLCRVADCILWSFQPENHGGIFYSTFIKLIESSLPHLFDGFNALFEHFLFSNNLDLQQKNLQSALRDDSEFASLATPVDHSILTIKESSFVPLLPCEASILDVNVLSQLAFFLGGNTVFRRLCPLYIASESGFSLGSIEHKVFNWAAPTIILVSGFRLSDENQGVRQRAWSESQPFKKFPNSTMGNASDNKVVFGAYLNTSWEHTYKEAGGDETTLIFQLEPVHEVFRPNQINRNYFTFTKSGISFGSAPSTTGAISVAKNPPPLGPISLTLDESLEFGIFNHDTIGGGAFLPSCVRQTDWQDRFEVESLEIWGCGGAEEAEKQRKAWAFEEREAAARKGMKRGQDIESDRALLEMAGLLGSHNAAGGSMG